MSANIPNDPVAIQKFFTSRDNNADASTYVGQEQRLWYDPLTNAIYVSDGNTPGGIVVSSSGSGNGVPGGPTNSIQYNAGSGIFGGTSNIVISGTGMVVVGNVSASYYIGNGSQLTGLYSNSDVANYLTTYTGDITAGNITITNTANLGNLIISDQTISGTITDRDITLTPVANGKVNVQGPFHVHAGNVTADPIFQVNLDGRVKTLVPNASTLEGAFNIVGSIDGTEVLPQNFGVMLHLTGQATIPARIYNDGVANYAAYVGRRYNGISSSPTPVLQNQIIGRVAATPYVGNTATGWPTVSTARIDFVATEDQTATNNGSKIQMWAVPDGKSVANIALVADFGLGGIGLTGNLIPTVDNIYSLGNSTDRWIGAYFGNAGIYIQDDVLGTNGQLSLDNGVLFINGAQKVQIGNMQMTTEGIQHITATEAEDLTIGTTGGGNTFIRNFGIKFKDNSIQETAAIPLGYMGTANGVATLGSDSKVDPDQLPAGAVFFKGTWLASNNTPTLSDGVGTAGWQYQAVDGGTVTFGVGNTLTFVTGDFVIYNGTVWQRIPGSGTGVASWGVPGNIRTGAVELYSSDITTVLANGAITNRYLANTGVTINTGTGLSGGGLVNLGASLTLVNDGVRAAIAGTGVAVSSATGNVTFSIGQAVAPSSSVVFNSVTSNTTIAATANITGGNLITGGRLVATNGISTADGITAAGNVTASYFIGNGSQLTGLNAFQTVVANGTNLLAGSTSGTLVVTPGTNMVITGNGTTDTVTVAVANAPTFSGNVTGSNLLTGGLLSATGNITGGNLSGTSIVGTLTTAAQTNITSVGTLTSLAVTGNITSGNVQGTAHTGTTGTFTGNVTTGNVSGTTGAFTNVSGTLTTAAQTNITSVGTLGSLAVTGNITSGNLSGTSIVGTLTTAAQTNITSVGTLTGLTSGGVVNLTTASNVALGPVANVHITGGTANYALITNGSGVLSWSDIAGISGSTAQTVASWVPTLTATGGGTFTYSIQTGYYIKSGRNVSCFFTVAITGVTGVSGTISLSDLPVTSINQTNAGGGALDNYTFSLSPIHVTGLVVANGNSMPFYWHDRSGSTNTLVLMTAGQLGSAATLIGRVTYISAT
jgi:hypothetical protein